MRNILLVGIKCETLRHSKIYCFLQRAAGQDVYIPMNHESCDKMRFHALIMTYELPAFIAIFCDREKKIVLRENAN